MEDDNRRRPDEPPAQNGSNDAPPSDTAPQYKKPDRAGISALLQLCAFLVVIILGWTVIGSLIYPQESIEKTTERFVRKYERVLVQISENLMDEEVNPGILQSSDVRSILSEGSIATQYADEYGAGFVLTGDGVPKGGSAVLLYRPDGEYVFTRSPEVWTQQSTKDDSLLWTTATDSAAYVRVYRLTDRFRLELSVEPSA